MTVYTQKQNDDRYPRNWDDQSSLRRTYSTTSHGRYRMGYKGYDATSFGSAGAPGVGGMLKKRTNSYSSSSAIPVSNSSTAAPLTPTKLTDSPPIAPTTNQTAAGILPTPAGVFDYPPSPRLTKNLLAQAHSRKRSGRHSLISIKDEFTGVTSHRILRLSQEGHPKPTAPFSFSNRKCLSAPPAFYNDAKLLNYVEPIDREGIPDDLYESLLSAASIAKKNGQHKLQRRRFGLSGEVETLLVRSSTQTLLPQRSSSNTYSSIFSPDPSLFNYC